MSDLIHNPSTRCPCLLVLDTSGSMSGAPIAELNAGIDLFLEKVKEDDLAMWAVDLGIVTFGGEVKQVLPFTTVCEIEELPQLDAGGGTPMGQAVNLALDALEKRKAAYKRNGISYYQPWMVLISDGWPTDDHTAAAERARALAEERKLVSLPIGVQGADLDLLSRFTNRGAKKLDGIRFRDLFSWLSQSMQRVSASASTADCVTLPSTSGWESV